MGDYGDKKSSSCWSPGCEVGRAADVLCYGTDLLAARELWAEEEEGRHPVATGLEEALPCSHRLSPPHLTFQVTCTIARS